MPWNFTHIEEIIPESMKAIVDQISDVLRMDSMETNFSYTNMTL